jgi:hypothetical protein
MTFEIIVKFKIIIINNLLVIIKIKSQLKEHKKYTKRMTSIFLIIRILLILIIISFPSATIYLNFNGNGPLYTHHCGINNKLCIVTQDE